MTAKHSKSDTSITGVILAGGRAERMGGRDKGLIPLAGQTMAAHVLRALQPQVERVLINANRHQDDYRRLGCTVISDPIGEFFGPLAGMLAALEAADSPLVLSVPCDSPLLPEDYAARMLGALGAQQAQIAVAASDRWQPVFALLARELRGDLRAALEGGERKIDRWFARHRVAVVDFQHCPGMFRNINTPAELGELEAELLAQGRERI